MSKVLLIAIWLFASAMSLAVADPSSPADLIRDLRRLQDRIAVGDTVAEAAHAKSIEKAAQTFANLPLNVWDDNRNARALIVYLFSGGSAPEIAASIPKSVVAADLRDLYLGALAYGMGDDAEARRLLMPIDPKGMDAGVGGHLALIQATLSVEADRTKAIARLDLARLLEPGTLVEEAALRKEMSLIGDTGDLDKFALLSRRYLNAFRHSIYADNFRGMVAATAVKLGSADSDEAANRLEKLLAGLDKTEQKRLYLMIARDAVIAGRVKMATLASEQAGRLAVGSPKDEASAMTYYGAATIVSDHYDLGMKALSSVQRTQLDRRDDALRASALAVATLIRTTPPSSQSTMTPDGSQVALLENGERSLGAASDILKSLSK